MKHMYYDLGIRSINIVDTKSCRFIQCSIFDQRPFTLCHGDYNFKRAKIGLIADVFQGSSFFPRLTEELCL